MNLVSKHHGVLPITRMWASLDSSGLERFQLLQEAETWRLQGTMLRVHAGQAIEARYLIECDTNWRTVKAEVEVLANTEIRTLLLENRGGLWVLNGEEISELDGCIDVDLGWTPSTNSLPIRRLELGSAKKKIGPIDVIWISFPDLSFERLRQTYEALGNGTYRFKSAGGFTADVMMDQQGLVHEYKGHWKRVL